MSEVDKKICSQCPHCLDGDGELCEFTVDYFNDNFCDKEEDVIKHLDDMLMVLKEKCPYILEHIVL